MAYLKRSIAALIFSGTALSAVADSNYYSERSLWDIHPYIGVDWQSMDFGASDSRIDMVGAVVGLQFNDYLGLELNWAQSLDDVVLFVGDESLEKSKVNSYGVGVTFQADLYKRVYAKSYIGYGRIDAKSAFKEDLLTAKLGLGYQISPDFAVEATYNHNFTHEPDKSYANSNGAGVQLKYYF